MERVERKYYPDGTLQEETHYLGERAHGPWRRWHPNGVLAEEYWLDHGAYVNGVTRTWYPNGVLAREVTYVNARQMGRFDMYNAMGTFIYRHYALEHGIVTREQYDRACETRPELPKYPEESPFERKFTSQITEARERLKSADEHRPDVRILGEGIERVERKYYPDGPLQEEIHYVGTREHGPRRKWHPNGVLAEEFWLERGVYVNCVNRTWYPNGVLASETAHVNGCLIGRVAVYDATGKVIYRRYALEDGVVTREQYDRACETRPELPKYPPDEPTPAQRKKSTKRRRVGPSTPPSKHERSFFDILLASHRAEAREWLNAADGARTLGELGRESSREFVEELYSLGACEVLAVEIENIPGTGDETTNHLLVRVPTDVEARERLFAFENEHADEEGFDGEIDRGQEYLYFKLA